MAEVFLGVVVKDEAGVVDGRDGAALATAPGPVVKMPTAGVVFWDKGF